MAVTRSPAEWHIVTCEYPPQLGGVSDYTRLVAAGLAGAGDRVHVWAPKIDGARPAHSGVQIHDEPGSYSRADLRRMDAALDRYAAPRRILVQWVPHGYGYWSMNVGFCLWLLRRARRHGDVIDIMVHEAFLPFRLDRVKENLAAAVHRLMTVILLRAATRVWYSIPNWEALWRPYALGRPIPFAWLPLPCTVPLDVHGDVTAEVRSRFAPEGQPLLGHFGTFGADIRNVLVRVLAALPRTLPNYSILLIGPRGEEAAREVVERRPDLVGRVHATGALAAEDVSPYIDACDTLVQPYTDGVSSRRTSFMAGLALGKPTVTTLGFASEPFWKDSGAAAFAAPDDIAALSAAAEHLLTDSAARRRIGASARDLYRARFDIGHIIRTLRAS
jgi:glycosyltransferase involved in cell wall biosynthesis